MKRIDRVLLNSVNESRDSLISGYCPDSFGYVCDEINCETIDCTACWNQEEYSWDKIATTEINIDYYNEIKGKADILDAIIEGIKKGEILISIHGKSRKNVMELLAKALVEL